jgi:hypothetical protein
MAITDNLISYWSLEEESGARIDAHGSNDLADNNTVLFTTGVVGNCADFELDTSEYLLSADRWDTMGFPVGHNALSIALWVRMEAKPGSDATPFSAYNTTDSDRVCQIRWDQGTDRFEFQVSSDGGTVNDANVSAATFGAPSTATWYYINCYHNPDTNLIGIQVNNGGWDTAALVGGIHDPINAATKLTLGRRTEAAGFYWDGEIDETGIWGGLLSPTEWTHLYNGGNGRAYADLDGSAFIPTATTIF